MEKLLNRANILIEALPYIQKLNGKTIVIKYGGNAMTNSNQVQSIMQDITLLKYVGMNPIVVHGGGPEINKLLNIMQVESKFYKGLRITDKITLEVVQMVLTGKINKDIVSKINALGGKAIGLCGIDGGLIQAKKMDSVDGVDLGLVGEITHINSKTLEILAEDEYIPIVAPIGAGTDGTAYNINADTAAGEIAAAMKAEKLIFLTDIDGIRREPSDPDSLISSISIDEIHDLLDRDIISGGMIPKVQACIKGIQMGVNRTHILNGTLPHPILLEIFTDVGIGTMVTA
ncbi:MAG TPA: acetylglutamate kinase [Clostridiales bacterium]|nr:acetylglutamate kinase [Clostridia bacterium]HCS72434.1 acetylglutamate kinase [Clostridiales bacterium]